MDEVMRKKKKVKESDDGAAAFVEVKKRLEERLKEKGMIEVNVGYKGRTFKVKLPVEAVEAMASAPLEDRQLLLERTRVVRESLDTVIDEIRSQLEEGEEFNPLAITLVKDVQMKKYLEYLLSIAYRPVGNTFEPNKEVFRKLGVEEEEMQVLMQEYAAALLQVPVEELKEIELNKVIEHVTITKEDYETVEKVLEIEIERPVDHGSAIRYVKEIKKVPTWEVTKRTREVNAARVSYRPINEIEEDIRKRVSPEAREEYGEDLAVDLVKAITAAKYTLDKGVVPPFVDPYKR